MKKLLLKLYVPWKGMEFYMENKTKNIIIVIEAVIIVVLVAFMILENNKITKLIQKQGIQTEIHKEQRI